MELFCNICGMKIEDQTPEYMSQTSGGFHYFNNNETIEQQESIIFTHKECQEEIAFSKLYTQRQIAVILSIATHRNVAYRIKQLGLKPVLESKHQGRSSFYNIKQIIKMGSFGNKKLTPKEVKVNIKKYYYENLYTVE